MRRLAGVVVVGRVFVVGVAVGVAYLDDPAGHSAAIVMVVGQQHDHEQQHNGTGYADYKASVLHAAKIRIIRRIGCMESGKCALPEPGNRPIRVDCSVWSRENAHCPSRV